MSELVQLHRSGPVAEIVLNNPARHNALSAGVLEGMQAAVAALALERTTRVVVLHGGGAKVFCAGADLKARREMTEDQVYQTVKAWRNLVDALENLPMPMIAAIHGACIGGGLEMIMGCDFRVAVAGTTMGLSELGLAIIPGMGGTQRLPRLVGLARAKELILTAERFDGRRAYEMGLVNHVVDTHEELLPAARALAERMCEMGPLALRAAKRAINGGVALREGLALEWDCYQSLIPTADRQEALEAFLEKRNPVFRGE